MNDSIQTRLSALGWRQSLLQQLSLDELEQLRPARVVAVRRDLRLVDAGEGVHPAHLSGHFHELGAEDQPTVGDWVLLSAQDAVIVRLLDRHSLLSRNTPGSEGQLQLLAANVDTCLLVSALNSEFNPRRLERYLAIVQQAGCAAVLVLTKRDLCDDPERFIEQTRELRGLDAVLTLDGLQDNAREVLAPWLTPGDTLVLLGSSGVGKSTLLNNLQQNQEQATNATRADEKGRHTTTDRALFPLAGGALLVDLPGLRELGLPPALDGVAAQFADVEALADGCRFRDCQHQGEPGCAVAAAVERGELSAGRLLSYHKLLAEARQRGNSVAAVQARRARDKLIARLVREVKTLKPRKG